MKKVNTTKEKITEALSELERGIFASLEPYSNVHRGSGHNSMVSTNLFEQARDIVLEYLELQKGKYIVIYDMDEYVYEDLIIADSLLKKNGDIDFLIGSRALEGKNYIYKKNYYGVRFLSILINLLFKTNITDAAAAIKFFRKEIYDKLKVETCGFDFEIDLLCKYAMRKHNIAEFPVQYFPRTYEQGKKVRAFKDGLTILRTILKNFFIGK